MAEELGGGAVEAPAPAPSVAPGPAPEAAPAATGGGGHQVAPGPAAAASEGVEVKRSQIKPIPDNRLRERDGTFKGPTKDLQRHNLGFKPKSERDASPERLFPGRSRAPAAPIEAKPGEQAPPLQDDGSATPPAEAKAPFKFAGRDWESTEQAEQSFRTLQGQYKPLIQAKETEERKAFGWYQHSISLQKELEQLKSGSAKPGNGVGANSAEPSAAPAPNSDPNDPFAGIDMGVYQLLAQTDGPQVAAAWLAGETAKNQATRTQALISEAIAPFKQAQERQQATSRITGEVNELYTWASSQRNPDGTPVFSELGDPQAERETGEIVGWLLSQGIPDNIAISPVGLKIASLLRRDALAQSGSSQSVAPSSPAHNPAAAAVAAALLQGQQAQDPVSGPSARTTQPGQPKTREEQVKSDIRTARLPDPNLGFIRRSSPI